MVQYLVFWFGSVEHLPIIAVEVLEMKIYTLSIILFVSNLVFLKYEKSHSVVWLSIAFKFRGMYGLAVLFPEVCLIVRKLFIQNKITGTFPGKEVAFHLTLSVSHSSGAWIIGFALAVGWWKYSKMLTEIESNLWNGLKFYEAVKMLKFHQCLLIWDHYMFWNFSDTLRSVEHCKIHWGDTHTCSWLLAQCRPGHGAIASYAWNWASGVVRPRCALCLCGILLGPASVPPPLSNNFPYVTRGKS